ncbi:MAG: GGDEF domain-containing protein [bacterium]
MNIIIYNQNKISNIESKLKNIKEYSIQVKNINEIKEAESLNPDLIILEDSLDIIKDTLTRNKIPAPLLIISDQILSNIFIRAEAYDYLLTPVKDEELVVRVANMMKIKHLKDEIKFVTTTDELTGLYNRTYLHQRLEAELSRSKRYNIPLSSILLDIDYFKAVNDIYGYDWGDVLLKDIAEVIKQHARKEDILTRYGDEEFIMILPNTDEDNTYIFAERLRKDIEKMEFKPDGEKERHIITISGGIASYPFMAGVSENAQTLIRYAEHALYTAKKRGKNKIIQFSQINLEF